MQNSDTCMFCRYRKARIAACCAGHRAVSAPEASGAPERQAQPGPSSTARPDRTADYPSRQDDEQFA